MVVLDRAFTALHIQEKSSGEISNEKVFLLESTNFKFNNHLKGHYRNCKEHLLFCAGNTVGQYGGPAGLDSTVVHQCWCGASFSLRMELLRHQQTHQASRFVCTICNKGFKYDSFLKIHMVSHSATRPHVCNSCGRSYKWQHHLKTHRCSNLYDTLAAHPATTQPLTSLTPTQISPSTAPPTNYHTAAPSTRSATAGTTQINTSGMFHGASSDVSD